MKHKWTTKEHIAVLALTKHYGSSGWVEDPLTKTLLGNGITVGSLGMAIRNFLHLLGLPGGLTNASQAQRAVFHDHGNKGSDDLMGLAAEGLR